MTHTTKHTPGPWAARKAPERNAYAWDVDGAQGTVPTIARIALVDRVAEVEANAHLIAAAPAMYEALQAAHKLLREWTPSGEDNQGEVECLIENALAQAEGSKP